MQSLPPEPIPSEPALAGGLLDPAALWRWKWRLAGTTCAAVLAGLVYLAVAAPVRHVGARLLVLEHGLLLNEERPAREDRNFLATQAEIIRSPAVLEPVVAAMPPRPLADADFDPLVVTLANLTVDPLAGTNVLSVRFRDTDSERALATLNAILGSYREYLTTSEHKAHQETLRLLREREEQARGKIAALQARIHQLRGEGPLLGQGREAGQVERSLLTNLGQMLADARNRRLQLESHLKTFLALAPPDHEAAPALTAAENKVSLASTTNDISEPIADAAAAAGDGCVEQLASAPAPLPPSPWRAAFEKVMKLSEEGWLGADHLQSVHEALLAAESREAELAQRLGPKHPDMAAVRSQIASLENRLREAVRAAPAALEHELHSIRGQESQLTALYRREHETTKALDDVLLEEEEIRGQLLKAQTLHSSILTQLGEWELAEQSMAEGRPRVQMRVLQSPTLTDDGLAPPKLVLAFCGLFGAIGGAFWISWRERAKSAAAPPGIVDA